MVRSQFGVGTISCVFTTLANMKITVTAIANETHCCKVFSSFILSPQVFPLCEFSALGEGASCVPARKLIKNKNRVAPRFRNFRTVSHHVSRLKRKKSFTQRRKDHAKSQRTERR